MSTRPCNPRQPWLSQRGALLGNTKPLLVLRNPRLLAELRQLEESPAGRFLLCTYFCARRPLLACRLEGLQGGMGMGCA